MQRSLPGQIADLYGRIAELERRAANRQRKGVVHEIDDAKGYRIKLGEDSEGKPFLTGWIPNQEMAMGDVRIATGLTLGEQVDIVSETGDLSDAEIVTSIQQDKFKRPPVKSGEYRIRREKDDTEIYLGPDKVCLFAKDASITVTSNGVLIKVGGTEFEVTASGFRVVGNIGQKGVHVDDNGVHV
jgi:phage baseplate assembly protein gpV